MVVGVATGVFLILADLVRKMEFAFPIDFVRAESYGSGTECNRAPTISFYVKFDIKGRLVILFLAESDEYAATLPCPDYFVVGYGMDYDHLYRNLSYIGVLKPELYK
ncbi:hypothetical protein CR513_02646, partial [Mucuna pruriens]